MELTILGSGTSVPDGKRNSAGYFVDLTDTKIMLDCGAGTVHALARYGVAWEEMTHLFISHFHVDHVGELASLFQAFSYGMRTSRSAPLTILGPPGLELVMAGLRHAFGEKLFEPQFPVRLRLMTAGEQIELSSGCRLSVAKTPHTDESIAVRIDTPGGSLCYTGDTSFSEELSLFFANADILISECSFLEPRETSRHLSVVEAARIAELANIRRLVVTHFYFAVDEASLKRELERDYSGEVIIGADGMRLST
jgi:ribonuclease BN (tRNA processing enzyme)